MANVNINKTTTDTQDNIRYTTPVNNIDYKGITLLVSAILGLLTIIWLIALGIAKLGCWYTNDYQCVEVSYIFWGYISILFAMLVIIIIQSIPAINVIIENMKYYTWRGVITYRDDIRTYAEQIISVASVSAKSEGTAGMDNYSPSITHKDTPITTTSPHLIDIPLTDILIEDVESEL